MKVAKWGNSLAIRLPAVVVEALELREGDEIEIHVADVRRLGVARKPAREELLKRLRAFRGRLPADFKFDRDEANAPIASSTAQFACRNSAL
ncbi:AbrB/MazE/SpoVT family DNA-binding domain-containing protein [Mesorhizobium ventifaucium]|uniref:AbrB/MazE/SpoVT family DNA-binding domain-containing protein n=1 Tax=Mesorhizobium ventifaucium TaxID=666020 RepID=UPI0020A758F8|nr:AbrB/MazE/SpoVT family DNA-binding domain-containing protein [Mesorhizobium ventifaucium]